MLLDERGDAIGESARLARDVLVWDEDGRTIRLEGDLTEDEALELAESLTRPAARLASARAADARPGARARRSTPSKDRSISF